MKILITGATGNVGSLVTRNLLAQGHRPRILARDARKAQNQYAGTVDLVVGDLADLAALRLATQGIDRLLLINSGAELAHRDALAALAAREQNVGRIVKLSTLDAQQQVGTGIWHAQGEAALQATGIPCTFVRPSGFMDNALYWAHGIKAASAIASCTGDGKIPFIHSQDIADVATHALLHGGTALPITGPEAMSYAEMGHAIGTALGRSITYREISEDEVAQRMRSHGETDIEVRYHLNIYQAIREHRLAEVTHTIPTLLGRPARRFEGWVQEHLAAFQA